MIKVSITEAGKETVDYKLKTSAREELFKLCESKEYSCYSEYAISSLEEFITNVSLENVLDLFDFVSCPYKIWIIAKYISWHESGVVNFDRINKKWESIHTVPLAKESYKHFFESFQDGEKIKLYYSEDESFSFSDKSNEQIAKIYLQAIINNIP
jgi:hypothetical protein